MSEQKRNTTKNQICLGLLAHVDAGKTTLSEAMLYEGGQLRRLGRVDHQDAFLDTDVQERERGITIFSKQAVLPLEYTAFTLLDTPGHVDFSSEMERTLQVLDYAVLVISGTDGVQSHTRTLWRLLERYNVPTFLFINKIDLDGADHDEVLAELQKLSTGCVDFTSPEAERDENIAVCDEDTLAHYLETGEVECPEIKRLIKNRKLFPCWFGSALKLDGVKELLNGLEMYTEMPEYPKAFGAKVFKIAHDNQGARLTYLKITGGALPVKMVLKGGAGENVWAEKADQLRIYSGGKFRLAEEVTAGGVCAVTGLTHTYPGQGLGAEEDTPAPVLESFLTYQVFLSDGMEPHTAVRCLRVLEEEDPQLHVVWNEQLHEIHVQIMGAVQLEVLQRVLKERFKMEVTFGTGSIVYRETIEEPVEGMGHFEPLRHYAEVHLLLEPGERGSGMRFGTVCSMDVLDRNWQNLILTHLEERSYPGVLTGSPITDMKITLLIGRAHLKHTEGGDFRQATYRAVRHGLLQAKSVLLEPWYDFRLEVPQSQVGRAISDMQRLCAEFEPPQTEGENAVITALRPSPKCRVTPWRSHRTRAGLAALFVCRRATCRAIMPKRSSSISATMPSMIWRTPAIPSSVRTAPASLCRGARRLPTCTSKVDGSPKSREQNLPKPKLPCAPPHSCRLCSTMSCAAFLSAPTALSDAAICSRKTPSAPQKAAEKGNGRCRKRSSSLSISSSTATIFSLRGTI